MASEEHTTRDNRQDVIDALQESLRRAVIQRDKAEEIASNAMARNAVLVGALHRYGRHKSWCAGCDPAKQDDFCTCGLKDAFAPTLAATPVPKNEHNPPCPPRWGCDDPACQVPAPNPVAERRKG